jgi:hypothetical protein
VLLTRSDANILFDWSRPWEPKGGTEWLVFRLNMWPLITQLALLATAASLVGLGLAVQVCSLFF